MERTELKEKLDKLRICLERMSRLASCLDRLSGFVAELASSLDDGPTQDMVAAVEKSHEEGEGWSSELLDEKCPKCGSPRIRKVDLKTGEEFVGCSGYPACRWRQRRRSVLKSKVAAVIASKRQPPADLSRLPF